MFIKRAKSRFKIGQKLVVAAIQVQVPGFASRPAHRKWSIKPVSYLEKTLNNDRQERVVFKVLEVFEERYVQGPIDDEMYFGYLLKDEAGAIWENQYPLYRNDIETDFDSIFRLQHNPENVSKHNHKDPFQFRLFEKILDDVTYSKERRKRTVTLLNYVNKDPKMVMALHMDTLYADMAREFKKVLGDKYAIYDDILGGFINEKDARIDFYKKTVCEIRTGPKVVIKGVNFKQSNVPEHIRQALK